MTINDNTLSTDMWTAVKTLLVNALSANSITASVEASYNDKKLVKPLIVIDPLKDGESNYPFGGEQGDKTLAMVITIYSPSSLTMDTIKDVIVTELKKDTIDDVQFVSYNTDYDFNYDYKNPQHAKTITANYIK